MLEAVFFDIGNVLLSFDFERTFRRLAPWCGLDAALIASRLARLRGGLESGQIGAEAFVLEATAELGYRGDSQEFIRAWQEIFEPIEQTHDLVKRLHGRVPLYLLSNTSGIHTDYFLPKYPVFECFEGAVFSHEVRLMKPDPEFYREALHRFGKQPASVLFIDDLAENIDSAAALGMRTHRYSAERHDDLEKVMAAAGF
jgi:HAD superfamily hydrolase (TIGR01509 family)